MADDIADLELFMASVRRLESGSYDGNYLAESPNNPGLGTAKGAYQIIDSTWNNFGGYPTAASAPKEIQDQWAYETFKRGFEQHGSWEAVARIHFTGSATGSGSDVTGTSTPQYVGLIYDYLEEAPDSLGSLVGSRDMSADLSSEELAEGLASTVPPPGPWDDLDRDRDGVFDRVSAFVAGEEFVPSDPGDVNTGQPQALVGSAPTGGGHVDETPVLSDFVNGEIPEWALESISGGSDFLLRGDPANAWEHMLAAAAADGIQITYSDGYRDIHDQHQIAADLGLYSQGGLAADPGTSNHGLGLAVDVNVSDNPAVKEWLTEHAGEYGFFAEVPREPWHYEYSATRDPMPSRAPLNADAVVAAAGLGGPGQWEAQDRDRDGVFDRVEAWVSGNAFDPTDFEPPSDLRPLDDLPPPTSRPARTPGPEPGQSDEAAQNVVDDAATGVETEDDPGGGAELDDGVVDPGDGSDLGAATETEAGGGTETVEDSELRTAPGTGLVAEEADVTVDDLIVPQISESEAFGEIAQIFQRHGLTYGGGRLLDLEDAQQPSLLRFELVDYISSHFGETEAIIDEHSIGGQNFDLAGFVDDLFH